METREPVNKRGDVNKRDPNAVTLRILRRYFELAQARKREDGEIHDGDMKEAMAQIAREARDAAAE